MELTKAAQTVFMLGATEARALASKNIDSEHVWLGILKSEDLLPLNDDDFPNMSSEEVRKIKDEIQEIAGLFQELKLNCRTARRRLRRLLRDAQQDTGEFSGHRSPRCREAFNRATRISMDMGSKYVTVFHLTLSVLQQDSVPLDTLFSEYQLSKKTLMDKLGGKESTREPGPSEQAKPAAKEGPKERAKSSLIEQFGRDLTQAALDGKIDPVIGRSEEVKRIAQILRQKKKNNPVLVGDAGVGKTCVVEGFALKCVEPNAPEMLKKMRIYELTMGALIAGTMYRGQFEERLEKIIKEASSNPDIVLFIDEIHTMVGAGGGVEGAMNAANILKPALARGLIKCIGATTTSEYRQYIEKDPALERRFQLVWVDEPTRDEAIQILKGLRPKFESHHDVHISDKAIEAAVELSMRHLMDFRLPDKAIDLIDQACAQKVMRTLSFSEGAEVQVKEEIGVDDIARVVSQRTRIPLENLTTDDTERLLMMENDLRRRVKGQDSAIKEVCEAVRTAKAGLKDPRRPVGVFLFLGSTGTGKTELAKALANFLFHSDNRLIRIDMSEYQEKHSIAKLIGAPPGYIGYQEEGFLSSHVRTNPYSVILFDEIEKAHPDIFDIFLQIFDEGMMTDAKGRRVNFRESIIVLTSNLGSAAVSVTPKKPIGVSLEKNDQEEPDNEITTGISIGDRKTQLVVSLKRSPENRWKDYRRNILEIVGRSLRPELLNRIQKKIIFYPLGRETVRDIIQKILEGINMRLVSRGNTITLGVGVEDFLMQKGYSERDGARQMERIMEQSLVQPLSKEILEGRIKPGEAIEAVLARSSGHLMFKVRQQ